MIHPLLLRDPHSNPRIFVKLFYVDSLYVIVPRRFLNHFEEELTKELELEDPIGNIYEVDFYYNLDEPRFGGNISQLRNVNQFQANMFIRFCYHCGARFKVRVFNLDHEEIQYKLRTTDVAAEVIGPSNWSNYIFTWYEKPMIIDLSSDEDSDVEVEDGAYEQLMWKVDLINGREPLVIPHDVQLKYFPDLTQEINVKLLDGSWTMWSIVWFSFGHRRGETGMNGEVCCSWYYQFYKSKFERLGNYVAKHKMQMWRMVQSNSFKVHVFTV